MVAGSYWNNQGLYQDKYEQLKLLIPKEGKADSLELEALRCISNYYYDVYNNGGANIRMSHYLIMNLTNSLGAIKVEFDYRDVQPIAYNESLDLLVDKIILLAWEKHGQILAIQH